MFTATAAPGGTTAASLSDGPGAGNLFTADRSQATFRGTGYSNTAVGFPLVEAFATPGGDDTADLTGDFAAANLFVGAPTFA